MCRVAGIVCESAVMRRLAAKTHIVRTPRGDYRCGENLLTARGSVMVRSGRAGRANPLGIELHARIHGVPTHGGCSRARPDSMLGAVRMNFHGVIHGGFARAGFL